MWWMGCPPHPIRHNYQLNNVRAVPVMVSWDVPSPPTPLPRGEGSRVEEVGNDAPDDSRKRVVGRFCLSMRCCADRFVVDLWAVRVGEFDESVWQAVGTCADACFYCPNVSRHRSVGDADRDGARVQPLFCFSTCIRGGHFMDHHPG